ncbi:hypothetical protein B296_00035440 [Ensete ventricosum]|uniref:Uncharacterized protein n=1 Tax=Ensete ventricosum TaxID=4639 RepID=A0A426YX07_ENSVE|nr:hypothetical protein B296_00035440 [Ensete ventricosum]
MVERCRRVEPERTPRNQLRCREEEGPVGWRLRCCKREALVAKAPPAEVSVVGLDVEKPALFLYDWLELPKKQAAARVSRPRSMVAMQWVCQQLHSSQLAVEAAVADGTVERGRRIDPSKDDDERAQ